MELKTIIILLYARLHEWVIWAKLIGQLFPIWHLPEVSVLSSWCLGWYGGSKTVSFMSGALVGYLEHWVQLGCSLFPYHFMSSPCDLSSKVIKLLTWLLMVPKDQGKSCKSTYDLPLEVKKHHFSAFYQLKLFTGPTRFKNRGLHRDMIIGRNGYRSHMLKSTTHMHSSNHCNLASLLATPLKLQSLR